MDTSAKRATRGKVRSETVTVRLDPKLRYLAELGARKQRRTLSSYIEWAIEASLERVNLSESGWGDGATTISDMSASLWDVEEADRFAKLALRYPDLLTHHEQVIWKLLRECGYFWRGHYDKRDEWTWDPTQESLVWERLRQWWLVINGIANGSMNKASMPSWAQKRVARKEPETDQGSSSATNDDDIPF